MVRPIDLTGKRRNGLVALAVVVVAGLSGCAEQKTATTSKQSPAAKAESLRRADEGAEAVCTTVGHGHVEPGCVAQVKRENREAAE
jgi:uncharacterized protein YceK